jgi:hypothetical protein
MDIKKEPKRAIITHFDGDPFVLKYWLKLYDKYWRGEVDTIYMSIAYQEYLPKEVRDYNRNIVLNYPEIKLYETPHWEIPEAMNAQLFKEVEEPYIGFIESDGWVFQKGLIDGCFKAVETEFDISAPRWELIRHESVNKDGFHGFMRNFFFAKKSLLDKIEFDLYPRDITIENITISVDCFGYISYQLYLLKPKIQYTETGIVTPDYQTYFSNFINWIHIRQFSSSGIGLGGGEFKIWFDKNDVLKTVLNLMNGEYHDGAAEHTFMKAVAFKTIAYDAFAYKEQLGEFAKTYKNINDMIVECYNLDRERLHEMIGYFKGKLNL